MTQDGMPSMVVESTASGTLTWSPLDRNPDLSGYRHRAVVARGGHRLGSNTTPMSAWLLGGDQSRCGGLAASSLDLVAAHPLAAGRRDGRTRLNVLENSMR